MTINKNIENTQSPRISVAPMMDWTTKDYRFFARLFNPNVMLYTEMVTTGAILLAVQIVISIITMKNTRLCYNSVAQIQRLSHLYQNGTRLGL
jgi:tRNA-dihydrouridine synthase